MMIENYINVQSIVEHNKYKDILLKHINDNTKKFETKLSKISNTDWSESFDLERPYVKTFIEMLTSLPYKHLHKTDKNAHKEIKIHNVWYNQYLKGDTHSWHTHGECQFTNIYFLELNNSKHSTQIFDGHSNEMFEHQFKEGDLVSFPSFFPHRSDTINTDERKTVIAFNTSFLNIN